MAKNITKIPNDARAPGLAEFAKSKRSYGRFGFFYFLTYPPKKQFEKKPTSEWQSTPTYTPVAYCDEFAVTTMVKKRKTPSKSTQAYKKLARYRQAFDELDVTEDGELSAAELHTAMREKGLKLSLSSTLSMMSDADANGDDSISFEEFTTMMDAAATFNGSKAWTTAVRVREEAHRHEPRMLTICSQ